MIIFPRRLLSVVFVSFSVFCFSNAGPDCADFSLIYGPVVFCWVLRHQVSGPPRLDFGFFRRFCRPFFLTSLVLLICFRFFCGPLTRHAVTTTPDLSFRSSFVDVRFGGRCDGLPLAPPSSPASTRQHVPRRGGLHLATTRKPPFCVFAPPSCGSIFYRYV